MNGDGITSRQRQNYIDTVKGLAILCITFLHFEEGVIPVWLNTWIGTFMITAFYFVSGWLMAERNMDTPINALIKKRIRSLGIPYLWFTLIILAFELVLVLLGYEDIEHGFENPQVLYGDIYKTVTLRGIGTLWFLPALFGAEILFSLLKNRHLFIKIAYFAFVLLYFYVYGWWAEHYGHNGSLSRIIDSPFFALRNMLNGSIVFAGGYYLHNKVSVLMTITSKFCVGIIGIILLAISFLFANWLPSWLSLLGPFFAPVLGPLGWLLLAYLTEGCKFNKFFSYWGINSLILMATHYSIVMVLCHIVNTYITGDTSFTGPKTIVYFLVAMAIEYPIVEFINRKTKFLLGKC